MQIWANSNSPQNTEPKNYYRTLSGLTEHCSAPSDFVRASLKFKKNPQRPTGLCLVLPDIVWISNLSPTASFLGEPYKYPTTYNGSPILAW
jgi:hypothetical protein